VFAAEGLLAADIRHMAQTPFRMALDAMDVAAFARRLAALKAQVEHELVADGVGHERWSFRALGDLRYTGQFHEIVCALPDDVASAYDAARLSTEFHRQHTALYGHADPAAPVEIVNLRVEGTGRLDKPRSAAIDAGRAGPLKPARARAAVLGADLRREAVPVFDRAALAVGDSVTGPAIIVQRDSTTVVLAGQRASAGPLGVLRIREQGA
jgi:N-methylhydantoinase A